ncbi:endolytic transglycosylase MltG [Magnetospirillum sulfuroxidans]|uniref:Endolytic murein transglycosylase n=1 Tax=Magnetospirillum sulfuroxidans TaxID=611300 RepID=A0ABS5I7K6_9PROT|nr:endolytic transglycosylase MltG [Magnetospirillum sulfuroxidans]MBR9970231.1 endolytic transglycosylase MltG [Magnetospirillum sulfuroxidans]
MRVVGKLLAVLAIVIIAAGTWVALEGHRRFTGPGPLAEAITIVVPKGAGLEAIARKLEAYRVVPDRFTFMLGTRLRQVTLKAGEYEFPARISAEEAMRMIADGRTVKHKLTIAEGLTVRQVLAELDEAAFLAGKVSTIPAEGWLLPETWVLSRDDDRGELVARMEKSMRQTLDELWSKRAAGLPLKSPEEALILASVVERETGLKAERPMVAGVFINRLRLGMRLQSDPTVIYGLSNGLGVLERPLTRADLDRAHAWNTYVIDRLPKTAIANPGRASLEAVLNPAKTDALYFVADGSGGHAFAKSLDEHNKNVGVWRKVEKDKKAK